MIENKKYNTDHEGNIIEEITLDISWESVKLERKQELDKSDWRFMLDQTPSQEWIDYRAFLRDLPQNHTDPNEAVNAWIEYIIPE
tara:strand:+ start:2343 stop:2597 length:255 start_codon:yes stop_codon:yes gene_type:complete